MPVENYYSMNFYNCNNDRDSSNSAKPLNSGILINNMNNLDYNINEMNEKKKIMQTSSVGMRDLNNNNNKLNYYRINKIREMNKNDLFLYNNSNNATNDNNLNKFNNTNSGAYLNESYYSSNYKTNNNSVDIENNRRINNNTKHVQYRGDNSYMRYGEEMKQNLLNQEDKKVCDLNNYFINCEEANNKNVTNVLNTREMKLHNKNTKKLNKEENRNVHNKNIIGNLKTKDDNTKRMCKSKNKGENEQLFSQEIVHRNFNNFINSNYNSNNKNNSINTNDDSNDNSMNNYMNKFNNYNGNTNSINNNNNTNFSNSKNSSSTSNNNTINSNDSATNNKKDNNNNNSATNNNNDNNNNSTNKKNNNNYNDVNSNTNKEDNNNCNGNITNNNKSKLFMDYNNSNMVDYNSNRNIIEYNNINGINNNENNNDKSHVSNTNNLMDNPRNALKQSMSFSTELSKATDSANNYNEINIINSINNSSIYSVENIQNNKKEVTVKVNDNNNNSSNNIINNNNNINNHNNKLSNVVNEWGSYNGAYDSFNKGSGPALIMLNCDKENFNLKRKKTDMLTENDNSNNISNNSNKKLKKKKIQNEEKSFCISNEQLMNKKVKTNMYDKSVKISLNKSDNTHSSKNNSIKCKNKDDNDMDDYENNRSNMNFVSCNSNNSSYQNGGYLGENVANTYINEIVLDNKSEIKSNTNVDSNNFNCSNNNSILKKDTKIYNHMKDDRSNINMHVIPSINIAAKGDNRNIKKNMLTQMNATNYNLINDNILENNINNDLNKNLFNSNTNNTDYKNIITVDEETMMKNKYNLQEKKNYFDYNDINSNNNINNKENGRNNTSSNNDNNNYNDRSSNNNNNITSNKNYDLRENYGKAGEVPDNDDDNNFSMKSNMKYMRNSKKKATNPKYSNKEIYNKSLEKMEEIEKRNSKNKLKSILTSTYGGVNSFQANKTNLLNFVDGKNEKNASNKEIISETKIRKKKGRKPKNVLLPTDKSNSKEANVQNKTYDVKFNLDKEIDKTKVSDSRRKPKIGKKSSEVKYGVEKVETGAYNENGEKVSGVWYDTNRRLWRVMYMENDKRKTRGFSPRIYGFNVARELAVQLKYEMNKKNKK